MARSKSSANRRLLPPDIALGPAYPRIPNQILKELRQALQNCECGPGWELTQLHLGRLCGIPRSTTNDWLCTEHADRFRNFVCGLERLQEEERLRFLRKVCRPCPRLSSARLAHDSDAIKLLESLLRQRNGFTIILGGSDEARTFLVTALGNSALRVKGRARISGIDLHDPVTFSPVPGVLYYRGRLDSPELHEHVIQVWPRVADSRASLVLLNRLWSAVPQLQSAIGRLRADTHVILADDLDFASIKQLRGFQPPVQFVRIFTHKTHPSWLHIQIEMQCK